MSWVSVLASVGMAVGPPLVYADQSEWHLHLYQTTLYGFSRHSAPKSERLTNHAFIGYSIVKKKYLTLPLHDLHLRMWSDGATESLQGCYRLFTRRDRDSPDC
ncbi:hypothetical protein CPB86DRAFT_34646 [Serendipita vermifera]|nr:hypothetical protein CPB86DRAFT_34646 [Serendipita vermifera]